MNSNKYLLIGLLAAVVQLASAVPVVPSPIHAIEFKVQAHIAESGPQNPRDPLVPTAKAVRVQVAQHLWPTILDRLFGRSVLPDARKTR